MFVLIRFQYNCAEEMSRSGMKVMLITNSEDTTSDLDTSKCGLPCADSRPKAFPRACAPHAPSCSLVFPLYT